MAKTKKRFFSILFLFFLTKVIFGGADSLC